MALDTDKLLNVNEAAARLGVEVGWLNKRRSDGKDGPPFHKLGHRVLYDPDDLAEWLSKNRRAGSLGDSASEETVAAVEIAEKALSTATAEREARRNELGRLKSRMQTLQAQIEGATGRREVAADFMAKTEDEAAASQFSEASRELTDLEARLKAFETVVIPDSETALAAAIEIEEEAARRLSYERAVAVSASAANFLETEYRALGERFDGLLRRLAEANALVLAANEALPDGVGPITYPEQAVRDRPASDREIISEEEFEAWAYPDGREPLSDSLAAMVVIGPDGTGTVGQKGSMSRGNSNRVVRKRFVRCAFIAERPRTYGPRLAKMDFPGLASGDAPYWLSSIGADRAVLQMLDRLRNERQAAVTSPGFRQIEVRLAHE